MALFLIITEEDMTYMDIQYSTSGMRYQEFNSHGGTCVHYSNDQLLHNLELLWKVSIS